LLLGFGGGATGAGGDVGDATGLLISVDIAFLMSSGCGSLFDLATFVLTFLTSVFKLPTLLHACSLPLRYEFRLILIELLVMFVFNEKELVN